MFIYSNTVPVFTITKTTQGNFANGLSDNGLSDDTIPMTDFLTMRSFRRRDYPMTDFPTKGTIRQHNFR